MWNVDQAVRHLVRHAQHGSTGMCARYTRQAIEAGGLRLTHRVSAKDYGPSLVAAGFTPLDYCPYNYHPGDVVIIRPIPHHPHGHMAMFDGARWISDFVQRDMYPGPSYRKLRPDYTIYRHSNAAVAVEHRAS